MEPVAQAIAECRALTVRMLEAAEGGAWGTVAELDAQRRPCFEGTDVAALPVESLERVLGEFRALMAMDGRLRDLAAGARQSALGELRQVRGRQQGRARYHELAVRG
jgi:hypothetical protein